MPASVTELSRVGLLSSLPGETLTRLAGRMAREDVPAGRTIVAEGERLLGIAKQGGVPLTLLGGVAVRIRTPDVPPALDREYKDLDFAVPKKAGGDADKLLRDAGYEGHVSVEMLRPSDDPAGTVRRCADFIRETYR